MNQQTAWQNLFTHLCYILVGLIIIALFTENFLFSSNLGILGFREIDDVAFQQTLRNIHLGITSGKFQQIFTNHDYAYGAIFWAPLALITYPLYLLSTYLNIDWPLIVLPRQISLLFGVLSLIILHKILKKMKAPNYICAATILIFALYPTFGYFSIKFGTTNALMFFSMLSFYLALQDNPSTKKGRIYIATSLAVAGGIKISGLLIAPLIFALIINHLPEKKLKQITQAAAIPAVVFITCFIIFAHPPLLIAPFKSSIAINWLSSIQEVIKSTQAVSDNSVNNWLDFIQGAFGSKLNYIIILLLTVGLTITIYKERPYRLDMTATILTPLYAALYLILFIRNGLFSGMYFTSISFLFVLGTLGWAKVRGGVLILVSIIALQALDLQKRAADNSNWYHTFYFNKSAKSSQKVIDAQNVIKCMNLENNYKWQGNIYADYRDLPLNMLKYGQASILVIFDNLSESYKPFNIPINYIVLHKDSPGALPAQQFDEHIKTSTIQLRPVLITDRKARLKLINQGQFGGQNFKQICEYGLMQVFKSID